MQRPPRDILYYSNYCPHSKRIIQQLVKEKDITQQLDFICIDRRTPAKDGPIYVLLDNGKQVPLPPNIHSVPSLLLVTDQFRVIIGQEIISYLTPFIENGQAEATGHAGEPVPISAGTMEYVSYNGNQGAMSNIIPTPPENYRPNKIPENITIEMLNGQYTTERSALESGSSLY